MSKQIEVMKLALDALLHAEDCVVLGEGGHLVVLNTYAAETVSEAITALREALAEQAAQQKPVAWCDLNSDGSIAYFDNKPCVMVGVIGNESHPYPLYTAPQPPASTAQQNSPWCMKMNGCKTKCEDCPDEVAEQPAQQAPDYAWPTIADYEKEVGFKVNDAFQMGWDMARTTNDIFKQMGSDT